MPKILSIQAGTILDSRGNPTVEVSLTLDGGFIGVPACAGRGRVPSGASTGSHEALAIPTNEAINNVNTIIKEALIGKDPAANGASFDQKTLDETLIKLDGTENKSNLGANAILGVSLAFAQAAAKAEGKSLYQYFSETSKISKISNISRPIILPVPMMNVLNGGRHVHPATGRASGTTDIQEFMIVPARRSGGSVGAKTFAEALDWGKRVFNSLQKILEEKNLETKLGDEGGFAPKLAKNEEALDLLIEAIKATGLEPGREVALAIDVAASEFYSPETGLYELKLDKKNLNHDEMITWYEELVAKYPIISIEDGLAEDDWAGWQKLTERLGGKIQLVGDDLFVTNIKRLREGIEKKVANAILIKPNQIGTITETIETVQTAYQAGYKCIISHRSGETMDSTIADLAVGLGTGQIKAGAPSRPERLAKYDRLVEIEKELGGRATYPRQT